jgi:hypothetical protein
MKDTTNIAFWIVKDCNPTAYVSVLFMPFEHHTYDLIVSYSQDYFNVTRIYVKNIKHPLWKWIWEVTKIERRKTCYISSMSISDRKTEVHKANELVEPIDEIRYFFEFVNELELGLYSSSNNLTTSIWLEKLPGLGVKCRSKMAIYWPDSIYSQESVI